MSLSRRGFLGACAAAAGGIAGSRVVMGFSASGMRRGSGEAARGGHAPRAAVPVTYFQSIPIERGEQDPKGTTGGTRSRLNVICGEGGNSLLVADTGGWVLVDTKLPPFGVLLRNHLKYYKADPAQPGLVINTHHHTDATGGNHAFLGSTPVLAHPKAIKRIGNQHMLYQIAAAEYFRKAEKSGDLTARFIETDVVPQREPAKQWQPKDFVPDRALEGDMEIVLVGSGASAGKCEAEVYHFGAGHTECDLVVRFPKYNVIHVGDLCFHRTHAIIDRGSGGNSRSWARSIEKIIDLCDQDTVIVPGRGELTDVQGLKDQVSYFDAVREKVMEVWKARKQRGAAETLVIEQFKDYALPANAFSAYGAIYDEIVVENRGVKGSVPVPENAGGSK